MRRRPEGLAPAAEPVRSTDLTAREEAWLSAAQQHVAELNRLLAERGASRRYEVRIEAPSATGGGA